MAIVAMGSNLEIRDDHPDYPALRFANYIFGESMKSRLMLRLREKEGLSYGAGSSLAPNSHESNTKLTVYAMAATENADKALELMNEEYARFLDSGVTVEELRDGQQSFKSRFDNLLANDRFVVRVLSSDIENARTFVFQQSIVDAIMKLSPDVILNALKKYVVPSAVSRVKAGDFRA
jgi:zinc protease